MLACELFAVSAEHLNIHGMDDVRWRDRHEVLGAVICNHRRRAMNELRIVAFAGSRHNGCVYPKSLGLRLRK